LKQIFLGTRKFGGGTKEILGGTASECPPVATSLAPSNLVTPLLGQY